MPAADQSAPTVETPPRGGLAGIADQVFVVSIDGLSSQALDVLPPADVPHLTALGAAGASTRNARTAVEMTVTLPNHASMMTGRRVDPGLGGHGVTINGPRPGATVAELAGAPIRSVFDVVHRSSRSALFTTKDKFAIFDRSWPLGIDRFALGPDAAELTSRAVAFWHRAEPGLLFLHVGLVDEAGHADGWMSQGYLDAVRAADDLVGEVMAAVDATEAAAAVVTADHGGTGRQHGQAFLPENYRIPFYVVAPGVPAGSDLYTLTGRTDPGARQIPYGNARQPVRNGDLANVVTTLLGLDAVPGSEMSPLLH